MSALTGDGESLSAGFLSPDEVAAGIVPSHGISLDVHDYNQDGRPSLVKYVSMPTYQSPLRHHHRTPSAHREVKETLDAHSQYINDHEDGRSHHYINQYIIGEEIGRGSFGAVHLATDQYGQEYAVKEFSKARLRKRAQSNIFRRPLARRRTGQLAAGVGFNAPLHRHSSTDLQEDEEDRNPLSLIKEEIAIMKKLNHPNLVSLIEVLDDPEEDSLYMVLEMCKKGVIMKVGLEEAADPYDAETCRCWFRDLILGIEYLHAQGIVHRDIKPDNLLLTNDDVLKVVDFGVSEMFEKQSDMMTAKSAGSPAFLPPELCVARHGDVSGRAADIWSMGVCLYCLRYGRIPFEREKVLELYEAIRNDVLDLTPRYESSFTDLMTRILEKDPSKRITMDELRDHPWVTKDGSDPLLSKNENTANPVAPPTALEMNHAITLNMKNIFVVIKAVKKFKALLGRKRPAQLSEALSLGKQVTRSTHLKATEEHPIKRSQSSDLDDRRAVETALVSEGIHREIHVPDLKSSSITGSPLRVTTVGQNAGTNASPRPQAHLVDENRYAPADSATDTPKSPHAHNSRLFSTGEKGHAHDPTDEEHLWLGIGTGANDPVDPEEEVIADSPAAADFNIYDTAYELEVERIREAQGRDTTVYLTRRVDSKKKYQADENMIELPKAADIMGKPHSGWKSLVDAARDKDTTLPVVEQARDANSSGDDLRDIAAKELRISSDAGETEQKAQSGTEMRVPLLANFVHKAMGQGSERVEENNS